MNHRRFPAACCGVLALAALLSACGGGGQHVRPLAEAMPRAGWAGRAGVGDAIELLNKGDATTARARLARVLRRTPGDSVAALLVKQIDTSPRTLLGERSFAYVARPGDTMSTLAARFLGNPMLFYGLARYNDMIPAGLAPGRTLRIPGEAPAPREPRAPVQKPAEEKQPRPAPPAPAAPATPAAPAARPAAAPRADAARAAKLRAAGLEAMNRGAIDGAIALLTQAGRLDPGNALIRRDLDRAIRIRGAVKAKR